MIPNEWGLKLSPQWKVQWEGLDTRREDTCEHLQSDGNIVTAFPVCSGTRLLVILYQNSENLKQIPP